MENLYTKSELTCEEAQLLMVPRWKDSTGVPGWLTDQQRQAFETHTNICTACAEEYEETVWLMDFVQTHWHADEGGTEAPAQAGHGFGVPDDEALDLSETCSTGLTHCVDIRGAWEDFQERCPDFADVDLPLTSMAAVHAENYQPSAGKNLDGIANRHGLYKTCAWLTGIAACFIIGGLIWMRFYTTDSHLNPTPSAQSLVSNAGETIRIEQIMPDGTHTALPTSAPITNSGNELEHLRINGKRHIVLDHHTKLSIEPLENNSLPGCLINLNAGRIHAQVEPDGKPFEVRFAQGKAVITGTTFDINVQDQSTSLIVSEGSVHFESDNGAAVQVTGGTRSVIADNEIPSKPTSCQAEQLMAWATGERQSATVDPSSGLELSKLVDELPWLAPYPAHPIDLESLDYDEFVENKRDWFKGQFPWIFQILKELETSNQQPATKLDYPDLLIQTGDIWQIVYPHRFYRQIAVIKKGRLTKLVNTSQLDNTLLNRVISRVTRTGDQPGWEIFFDEAALNQWLTSAREFERACGSTNRITSLCEYSMIVSEYLENTRTLVWLCIQHGVLPVASNQKEALLDLLQQQITLACQAGQVAWYLSQTEDCSEDGQIKRLITLIEAIREHERQLSDYQLPVGYYWFPWQSKVLTVCRDSFVCCF